MTGGVSHRVSRTRPIHEKALGPWVLVPLAILLGAFITLQFFHLSARYIKLMFALFFFLAVTRLSFAGAMAIILIIFPAPTFIYFGDTNVIFIAVMAVIWMVRLGLRTVPRPIKSPIDWAIGVYLLIHAVSFLNIRQDFILHGALLSMEFMTAGTILYFLLINAYRTEKQLEIALKALMGMALFVDITAVAEFYFGFRVVPAWFINTLAQGTPFGEGDRAGGVFGFHGLLADTSAMLFLVQVVLGLRARSAGGKCFYYLLAALSIVNIVNSANRGGVVILAIGCVYLLWFARGHIHWPRLILAVAVGGGLAAAFFASSAPVIEEVRLADRLAQTTIEGVAPEDRADVWREVLHKVPDHLWLGHGPFIDIALGAGKGMHWPHNGYLFYLYTTGILGLSAFLWILLKILWKTYPRGSLNLARAPLAPVAQVLFHVQVVMFMCAQWRDEHQRGNVYIYWMWIIFALAISSTRIVQAENMRRELPLLDDPWDSTLW